MHKTSRGHMIYGDGDHAPPHLLDGDGKIIMQQCSRCGAIGATAIQNSDCRAAPGMLPTPKVAPDITVAREIAARLWCDREMESVTMDPDACEEIARIVDRVRSGRHVESGDVLRDSLKALVDDWRLTSAMCKPGDPARDMLQIHARRLEILLEVAAPHADDGPRDLLPHELGHNTGLSYASSPAARRTHAEIEAEATRRRADGWPEIDVYRGLDR